ncbi:hypothetical protein H0H92_003909 [Tricholoma furcatifolium]|nr:hypothetical protein H0H92_003909 [Tricholoma furcatifolium]
MITRPLLAVIPQQLTREIRAQPQIPNSTHVPRLHHILEKGPLILPISLIGPQTIQTTLTTGVIAKSGSSLCRSVSIQLPTSSSNHTSISWPFAHGQSPMEVARIRAAFKTPCETSKYLRTSLFWESHYMCWVLHWALTNAGGAVSDIWNARERGLASAIYATVPFLGPVIGPIVGGFVAQNPHLGWHFNFWLIFIFSAITLCLGYFLTPETYGPVLLRRRAQQLSAASNYTVHYSSVHDLHQPPSFLQVMRANLSRPFVFIVTEPIVLLLAIYISVMYGTLYAMFSAFPIVFQDHRGFTPGQGGLAFLGIGVGITLGVGSQSYQDRLYRRAMDKSPTGKAPPEARLHTAIMGGVLIPIGLFLFAWTTPLSIPWIVPVLAGVPFGAGVAQILQSLTTYLMDTYPLYFASSIAATIVLRSFCGAAFPLFSPTMFAALGDQWAMSVFAFLSLACTPIPILFFRYGSWIRSKSRVACKDSILLRVLDVMPSSKLGTIEEKAEEKDGSKERLHESATRKPSAIPGIVQTDFV